MMQVVMVAQSHVHANRESVVSSAVLVSEIPEWPSLSSAEIMMTFVVAYRDPP